MRQCLPSDMYDLVLATRGKPLSGEVRALARPRRVGAWHSAVGQLVRRADPAAVALRDAALLATRLGGGVAAGAWWARAVVLAAVRA